MSSFDGWLGQNVPESIMEDAAAWMALLDSEECSPTDRLAFARWLAEDPLHQWGFEELSEVWARLHTLTDINQLAEHPKVTPFPAPLAAEERAFPPAESKASKEWSTLAATALVVIGACIHLFFGTPSESHQTQVGEVQTIALEDGSRIELNALSSVEVHIDDRRRRIELMNGEALFHVEQDERPFVVTTPLGTVSAVGTQFAVHASASMVEVSVIEGLVSVAASTSHTALTEYESDLLVRFTDEIALLGAGQRIELTRESQKFLTMSQDHIEAELSWRNGEVVFSERPLMSVLSEMRRYLGAPIFIGDPELNTLRISGRFRTGDVDAFLAQLGDDYGIVIDRDDRLTVLRAHPPRN